MVRTRASGIFSEDSGDAPTRYLRPNRHRDYFNGSMGVPNNANNNHNRGDDREGGYTRNGSLYGAHIISPKLRRRPTAHHYDESSSSDSPDDKEDAIFEKKKRKSLAKQRNQCLPLNFKKQDMLKNGLRDRTRVGASLADIDPMNVDHSVLFDQIGGLDSHVAALKEMILFPLLYPEVFDKYKIRPPRGVLFHGPPGTGKTLVARALCNECSTNDRKVAFFMRKGADCLSKWVGESERQLRLLFDQAYTMRPAIIFFDEIDGIAPVRSSKQDQIHSSIVSTLLALMDGLDDRGQVIVIGATNRIDAIDPALRRPGRFDREFYFPLPSLEARRQIIKIHTRDWVPPLSPQIVEILAARTPGYCGADLKALCAETALIALKSRYPQIYKSRAKLLLNIDEITIQLTDFNRAMRKIVPASQRSVANISSPLCFTVKPLLSKYLSWSVETINSIFPAAIKKCNNLQNSNTTSPSPSNETDTANIVTEASEDSTTSLNNQPKVGESSANCDNDNSKDLCSEDDDIDESDIFGNLCNTKDVNFRSLFWRGNYRPRFLIHGKKDQAQSTHLGPAILHFYEHVTHSKIDYSSIYSVPGRTPEESISAIFTEICKRLPSILYLPRIDQWWQTLPDTLRLYLSSLIEDLEPHMPVLLLATSDTPFEDLPIDIKDLFNSSRYTTRLMEMSNPTREERVSFFSPLFEQMIFREPAKKDKKAQTEQLPLAPPSPPRKLTDRELCKLRKREETTLRELRLFLRECLGKLSRDKRFSIFVKPVDLQEVPDYLDIVKNPMALETMMAKIDTHKYECASQFLEDVELICHNALEYNPDKDSSDKLIRHRACALRDAANALIEGEMDSDFEQLCQEIHENRKNRGETTAVSAPSNYWTVYTATTIKRCAESPEPAPANSANSTNSSMDSKVRSENFNVDEETEIESGENSSAGKAHSSSESITKEVVYRRRKRGRRSHRYPRWKKFKGSSNHVKAGRNGAINGKKLANNKEAKSKQDETCESALVTIEEKVQENGLIEKDDSNNQDNQSSLEGRNGSISEEPNSLTVNRIEEEKEEPVKVLIIDRVQVTRIFNQVVDVTEDCSIEQLEEIYSCLFRVINKRRNEWNRTLLLEELFGEIEKFERHKIRIRF